MKKIGQGWQYTTYDLGNGRVLKKYNSKLIGYIHMFKICFPFKNDPIWKLPEFYRGCKETARDSIKKVQNPILESWMMGNPKILNELDYEQDKIIPLHVALSKSEEEKGRKIIDDFIKFNKTMLERSIIDKSFNITQNFALDKNDRIILMDLGELYSSREAIDKQIKDRAWAKHYVINPLPIYLRDYFVNKMDEEFGDKKVMIS